MGYGLNQRVIQPGAFELGEVVTTPGALARVPPLAICVALARHRRSDWGDVGAEDWNANDRALKCGDRLLSVYHTPEGVRFWVITEANRSATTILLPEEY